MLSMLDVSSVAFVIQSMLLMHSYNQRLFICVMISLGARQRLQSLSRDPEYRRCRVHVGRVRASDGQEQHFQHGSTGEQ